ncbi:MAG TPA: hypothetical protein VLQ80_32035, partial [Candidatus Saccharimonadia bacterium]|nr:hypothetical protein [Candidatus Saccharimonadia bacterium]
MTTRTTVKKIDADTHFLPPVDMAELRQFLPKNYNKEAVNMLLRDAGVFADPNARRGGFRASAAGQRVTGSGHGAPVAAHSAPAAALRPAGGAIGHGSSHDRAGLLPETGFDMQVLIPDGI